jgi:5'-phosphate synthase pdxT subunit
MKIGVLALQGDFQEHIAVLRRLGVEAVEVRLPRDLEGLDGLIIPGGESTTLARLAADFDLIEPLRAFGRATPTWGTCAGMIFLAQDVGRSQPTLGLMNIEVDRNAFGRQVQSFETDLDVAALTREDGQERPFHAVFIRAPAIRSVGPGVEVLVRLENGTAVAARQGHLLATAFHPELTGDDRFHRYFLEFIP